MVREKTNSGKSVSVRYFIYLFNKYFYGLFMTFLLPGQPVPAPVADVGRGVYLKYGQLRASVAGTLTNHTLTVHRQRPHPPATNSLILGTVIRLSPLQAVVAISVVDGIPLPLGEEFTGVIRTQDIRATEKDKVKIADCFRGGDVIKGLVVRRRCPFRAPSDISNADLPRRRTQLLHHDRAQRPRRHLCHQRGRWVHVSVPSSVAHPAAYRCHDGASVVAGDALPEHGQDRKAQMCQTRECMNVCIT